jgi:DNA ligase-associated metallophosphoesterase
MSSHPLTLHGIPLTARASGALWWPGRRTLVVSDLRLGKSERLARRGGPLLPPYDSVETLMRLDAELAALDPATVICLGDSFDDLAAAALPDTETLWLSRLMAGRRWIWIAGNHDPGPVEIGGSHVADLAMDGLQFRHEARPGAVAEVSGHYHPKARLGGRSRPCFLADAARIVMPAFGSYTGGLSCTAPALRAIMAEDALAIVTGGTALAVPLRAL